MAPASNPFKSGIEATPDNWKGEPHTLIVHSVQLPADQFDDGELDYDIVHPASCRQEELLSGGASPVMARACDIADCEDDVGLAYALRYSGTPVTRPGTYRIQSWSRRYYLPDEGAHDYDGGVTVLRRVDITRMHREYDRRRNARQHRKNR